MELFLENDYVIPLFDIQTGGPPRAFECRQCGKVSKTETGMLTHLHRSHQHEVQPCLFSMENLKNQNSENPPRKSRISPDQKANQQTSDLFNSATATKTPGVKTTIPDSDMTTTGKN